MVAEEKLYQELVEKIKVYHPFNDFEMLEKAYRLAHDAHKDQKRKSGEPYVIHPLKVAYILAELELDMESIVAGILHDVIEDTVYSYEDISKMFSEEIATLVEGVTKLGKLSYSTKEEIQAENYRKMFLAMAKDIRVILIKLADRLHNMRTLNYMTLEKQREKAQETLDIYAPLAHRLGISKIRTEMEDLCFKYLNADAYFELATKIEIKRVERETFVQNIAEDVKAKMLEAGIEGKIEGRSKHFFSIYKKMLNQNKTVDQIYDLFAVRAIVDNIKDCYAVLGIVHTMYTPMPGRFKDYIAMPKPNMYQSLHNTLLGPGGQPFEIQIRTWDMHRTSEYGIAAHWKYKEGKAGDGDDDSEEAKLAWLRQILEWQKDMSDNKEYLDTIKLDLNVFTSQAYAFTPQGKVIQLPKDSTPIDFAYMIHSAVGNKMVGARVNNRMVTIDYKIQNGDIVEIMTSQNSRGPSRDWLNLVKSSQARTKIKQWFKKEEKEDNILRGKEMLLADMKKKALNPSDLLRQDWMEAVMNKYDFKTWDAILAAIGYGGIKEGQVVNRLRDEYEKENKDKFMPSPEEILKEIEKKAAPKVGAKKKRSKSGIVVEGVGDVAVRFSKCCSAVPGDEIIGFVTRGRGVTIHRTDCINVMNLSDDERARLINAEWDSQYTHGDVATAAYLAEIRVIANDRTGLLFEVSRLLADDDISVKGFNIRTTKDMLAIFNITIEIRTKDQLERVTKRLKSVKDVIEIERVTG